MCNISSLWAFHNKNIGIWRWRKVLPEDRWITGDGSSFLDYVGAFESCFELIILRLMQSASTFLISGKLTG